MHFFDVVVVGLILLSVLFLVLILRGIYRGKGDFEMPEKADFEKRFPPISDEEFLARCTPGTNPQVALKVRKIVAEHLGVDYYRIYPSTRFVEDLNLD